MFLFILGLLLIAGAITLFFIGRAARRGSRKFLEEAATAAAEEANERTSSYSSKRPQSQRLKEDATRARVTSLILSGVGILLLIVGAIMVWSTVAFQNGQGEAKVEVNSFTRAPSPEAISGPQFGFKAPWVDFVEFDLAYQELVYAGGDTPPSYTGGTVNGKEITINVGGLSGGSTQGNSDATFVYNLDPDQVVEIYKKYPYSDSQARFTRAIIEKQTLNLARQQSEYTATEFRGSKQAEAQEKLQARLNEKLGSEGVEFTNISFQDTRYADNVEEALRAVEVANQKEQEAEANLRATEISSQAQIVEAENKAKAQIAAATGEAEANRLLSESLTPEVLKQRYLDTLAKLAAEGNLVITDGTGTEVLVQK